ncbi:Early meiotic induction 1 [Hyphodiscus hymeniophilus]|uniref:Early meiotic induction 1 n=1 Tax=Hyphodiscus hymeniophilus TaxID=353542 RepID=A0A9P6VJ67_9HELO|nr:Early meiotic induction 1 [Hyphodiscus hymeniophilus]
MGWLWSSTSSAQTDTNALPPPNITSQAPSSSSTTPPSSAPLSNDELAERDFRSFLDALEADTRPSSTKYSRVPKIPPPASSSQSPSSISHPSEEETLSEQLLPRTMSCRTAFDAAFYCNSLGGQFNNLYRYGTVRSCSENWNDFWFCMRTRTFSAPQKEEAIRGRYREKEKMRYERRQDEELGREWVPKSSEDVWKSRERKMEWGKAFSESYEEFDGDDGEWNRVQKERRTHNRTMRS